MAPVAPQQGSKSSTVRPRVLVVDDEPTLIELIGDVVGRDMGCRIVTAPDVATARRILSGADPIELLVTDVNLPDGDGMSLLATLQKHQPRASAIVITGAPSMDGVITALRGGALDFVPKPFTHQQLVDRVRQALDRQARAAKEGKKIDRLKDAVKRLNEARKVISKKVDLLCNDLVTAYGELSRQLDGVRTQEGFRKYVAGAKDLEQLLCHSMDWLLRQVGYANVGVWLAAEDGEFQLGAYMKYTVAGDQLLTDAIKREILPLAVRDGNLRLAPDELVERLHEKLTPQEMAYLKGQELLAVNCTYLGESLAAIVFFRDARSPFSDEDETILKSVSPIFAVALASIVRDAEAGEGDDEDGNPFCDSNEGGLADDTDEQKDSEEKPPKKRKPRKDDADWWKRGEAPPF